MTPGSDVAEQSRLVQQDNCKRKGIRPASVAWEKLARLNRSAGDTEDFIDFIPRTEIARTPRPIDFLSHARIDAQIDKVDLGFSL